MVWHVVCKHCDSPWHWVAHPDITLSGTDASAERRSNRFDDYLPTFDREKRADDNMGHVC